MPTDLNTLALQSQRGFVPMDDKDVLDKDLEEYFAQMGIKRTRIDAPDVNDEDLDKDLENYFSKPKATGTVNGAAKASASVADLGDDLDKYFIRGKENPSANRPHATVDELDDDLDKYFIRRQEKQQEKQTQQPVSIEMDDATIEDLDKDLDEYFIGK